LVTKEDESNRHFSHVPEDWHATLLTHVGSHILMIQDRGVFFASIWGRSCHNVNTSIVTCPNSDPATLLLHGSVRL